MALSHCWREGQSHDRPLPWRRGTGIASQTPRHLPTRESDHRSRHPLHRLHPRRHLDRRPTNSEAADDDAPDPSRALPTPFAPPADAA